MESYFLIIHKPGPAWMEGKGFHEQNLMEHGSYIHSLHEKGVLLEGGPFLDHSGGMALIAAENLVAAGKIVDQDPAVKSGIFSAEIRPWMRVDWENYG